MQTSRGRKPTPPRCWSQGVRAALRAVLGAALEFLTQEKPVMPNVLSQHARRRGAVTPLMAIMLVVIVGLLSLSIDLGYIAVVRSQLQNAADSAASVAARQR